MLLVALVVLLAVQPWKKSSGGDVETFELNGAITVDVRVPDGWTAHQRKKDDGRSVWMVPSSENRSFEEIATDEARLRDGASASPVHEVIIVARSCDPGATNSWSVDADVDTGVEWAESQQVERVAQRRVHEEECVVVFGLDWDASSPTPTASDLVKSMIDSDAVQARVDSSRPSVGSSY